MPKSVPTCTWVSYMRVREKGESRDGEMERLRQEDFVLAGLNAAQSPQPNCGTGVLLQSATLWRQMDPPTPSQNTHIYPCGIRVTERGWWTAGDWVGEWVPVAGTAPAGTAGRGMGTCQGAGSKVGCGTCFFQSFLSFSGL